jgi:hypothetical protein
MPSPRDQGQAVPALPVTRQQEAREDLRQFVKQALIFIGVMVVLLETASWVYIRFINQNVPLPTYSFVNAGSRFWVNIDEHFGVWHEPGSKYLHNKSCFAVQYTANSHGMRDRERSLESDVPRIAVLGDSFMEGWGNELNDRLSDRLESATGREALNFGTSGGFGTIQEWLQYKHLVKKFRHDVVLVGMLPHNDFTDNDYDHAVKTGDKSYRPYLTGAAPNYTLTYYRDTLPEEKTSTKLLKSFDFTLREWSSFYRVMRYLGSFRIHDFKLVPRWVEEFETPAGEAHSMYYDYKPAEWDIMRYCLEEIIREAEGRQVIVFTIPVPPDLTRYDGTPPPLTRALTELAAKDGFTYVDLLGEMASRNITGEDMFFVCDNHWDARGNELAASVLLPYVTEALTKAERHTR